MFYHRAMFHTHPPLRTPFTDGWTDGPTDQPTNQPNNQPTDQPTENDEMNIRQELAAGNGLHLVHRPHVLPLFNSKFHFPPPTCSIGSPIPFSHLLIFFAEGRGTHWPQSPRLLGLLPWPPRPHPQPFFGWVLQTNWRGEKVETW